MKDVILLSGEERAVFTALRILQESYYRPYGFSVSEIIKVCGAGGGRRLAIHNLVSRGVIVQAEGEDGTFSGRPPHYLVSNEYIPSPILHPVYPDEKLIELLQKDALSGLIQDDQSIDDHNACVIAQRAIRHIEAKKAERDRHRQHVMHKLMKAEAKVAALRKELTELYLE